MRKVKKGTSSDRLFVGSAEAHLALAQQVAHVGSWELDLNDLKNMDNNPLRWSDETYRLLGFVPGEVTPSNELFFQAVHPDDRSRIRSAIARAINEQISYNLEHRVTWPDGTERHVHEQSTIVYDDGGKPVKMLGVVQDITHRKKAEASLELQAFILKKLAVSVVVTDPGGRIIYWNEGAETIFGYARAEILEESISRLYPATEMRNHRSDLTKVVAGRDLVGEWEGVRKNGAPVWVDVRSSALKDADGNVIGVLSIARDVTREKEERQAVRDSERLYRAVGESIKYGVWVCDPKGRLTHMSDSFMSLLGLTRDQNLSDGWLNALHPDERPVFMSAWRECLAQGEIWNRRNRVLGVDGLYHSVLTHAAPVRDENGGIQCWAGLNLDLSQFYPL